MTEAGGADWAALEEIRRLKYRYLRAVDLKQWDELADTLTPDATADYGTPALGRRLTLAGRGEIVGFLRGSLGPDIITVHAAGQPEIDIAGNRATGTWAFQDTVIAVKQQVMITGAAFYQDSYECCADRRWRIASTGYVRTYEAIQSLPDLPGWKLTANRWAAEAG